MSGSDVLKELSGGDRRSIGNADHVVQVVLRDPRLFYDVFSGLRDADPVIRMRCADVAEKVSRHRPDLLQPYAHELLDELTQVEQQEVRWHVALLLPRLQLSDRQQEAAVQALLGFLQDRSRIVQVNTLQALAEFAEREPGLRRKVLPVLEEFARTGSAAVRARAHKMLARLRS